MARRCFFSFHYQDVIDFRANVVRNHNVTKADNGGFFDASIWEGAKKQGDLALKRLINGGLDRTSVTVVLIGSQTYARRWVRYEIMKSIERGNALLGIHINNIRDRHKNVKALGPNPFDYLGLQISADGCTGTPTVWNGIKWVYYDDLGKISIRQQAVDKRDRNLQLSTWFSTYDWVEDDGFNNFGKWVA
ncbi:TIR domain-containing protein [Chromobacterium piscinae]|uniref:TIR domain-containing protein n=1 Tax=Chromobacterium piscinae TaxID=686831 RepID=UPI001E374445|nr:TIR domain-containing protein [Chromobacterium piscinae]MCD5326782.1 TIR domain-containing protein [Chromobacterium piscinae]